MNGGPALTLDGLRTRVDAGEIDTVLLSMCDMQGRLQGKRLDARHFLSDVVEHGAEGCNYLLAVDVEMNTVSGYAMSSWETGYGDFEMVPDMQTLRLVPWLEATALVLSDLRWDDGREVVASPRQVLRRQLERLAARGWSANAATELEFLVFRDSYELIVPWNFPLTIASWKLGPALAAGNTVVLKPAELTPLGGKSPNIVFADADLEAAASAAPGAVFGNAGQDCCARSRILVQRPAVDRFLSLLEPVVTSIRVGDPLDPASEMGRSSPPASASGWRAISTTATPSRSAARRHTARDSGAPPRCCRRSRPTRAQRARRSSARSRS
jgi:hypothetical protein